MRNGESALTAFIRLSQSAEMTLSQTSQTQSTDDALFLPAEVVFSAPLQILTKHGEAIIVARLCFVSMCTFANLKKTQSGDRLTDFLTRKVEGRLNGRTDERTKGRE